MRTIDEGFTACAQAALANDFDAVPWNDAPEWRRMAAIAVAEAALDTNNPDAVRSAWVLSMTVQGWRWDREFNEALKTHPGVVFGELTKGGTAHWKRVSEAVRAVAREHGVRMLGP